MDFRSKSFSLSGLRHLPCKTFPDPRTVPRPKDAPWRWCHSWPGCCHSTKGLGLGPIPNSGIAPKRLIGWVGIPLKITRKTGRDTTKIEDCNPTKNHFWDEKNHGNPGKAFFFADDFQAANVGFL